MKKSFWAGLLCLCGAPVWAQTSVWQLWPGMECKAAVTDTATEEGVVRLTQVTCPTLAVYKPASGSGNGTGIVICPGGGYQILAYDKEGTDIASWLAGQGYTAFVLAYRVPDRRNEALQDLQRAVRMVRGCMPDLKRVGVMGFSAGASLSARLSARFAERLYVPVDGNDSCSARPDFCALIYPAYLDGGPGRTLTPELVLPEQIPPMFIFATADDGYSNSALVMAGALRDRKTPVELHLYPKGGHGYGMRRTAGKIWPSLMAKWLESVMTE